MSALKITLKKSLIGYEKSQALCAKALGLGKVGSSVIQPDTAPIRGSIKKLVTFSTSRRSRAMLPDRAPARAGTPLLW